MHRVLITAGGTREPIDDVRVLANRSTGRFGIALARAFVRHGAEVTVLGAHSLLDHPDRLPESCHFVGWDSSAELRSALDLALAHPPDLLLMAAAVADYLPAGTGGKIPSDQPTLDLHLRRAPKLLPTLRARCPGTRLIGFKLLSGATEAELIDAARLQQRQAQVDGTIANELRDLRGDRHPVTWVTADAAVRIDGTRDQVAAAIAARLSPPVDVGPGPLLPSDAPWPRTGRARTWWTLPGALAAPAPPISDPPSLCAWLLNQGWDADEPAQAWLADGTLLLGMSPADAAQTQRLLLSLPAGRPILHRGRLVGVQDGRHVHLVDPDPGWAELLLAGQDIRAVSPDGADATRSGWRAGAPPWTRDDLVPAASTLLWHRVTDRVLLGQRPGTGVLAPPGGRAEAGETAMQAAKRELHEETGIDLDGIPHRLIEVRRSWTGQQPCFAIDAHLVEILDPPPAQPTAELDAAWWSVPRALRDRRLVHGAAALLRHRRT